jgi:hypothetical protein
MNNIDKQYCFNFVATNDISRISDFYKTNCNCYSDAMNELTEYLINLFGSGFRFVKLEISVMA